MLQSSLENGHIRANEAQNLLPLMFTIFVIISSLNCFLLYGVMDGKTLLSGIETKMGRELIGVGLEPAYREVNDYYAERGFLGALLYLLGFKFIAISWASVSIIAASCLSWALRRSGFVSLVPALLILAFLAIVYSQWDNVDLISAWLE